MIYTSGSTGRPKGVAIEHASLVPYVQRLVDAYGITERDRGTKYAGVGFDASIIEIFPPLAVGGELHVVPDELRLALPALAAWMAEQAITITFFPTQLAEEFMKEPRGTALRWMLVGGDRLRRFTPASFQLANEYGPTECTVSATSFVVDAQYDNIPIGKPNANTKIVVLDPTGQPCPPGLPGEICIAGRGLARGYLASPEVTAKKFVDSPLVGGRLYHTGDLGRWLDDGNLEFLGRIDNQVKIRGYRIELGEIEHAMLQVPGVRAAVVSDCADAAGDKFLAGYFVGDASPDALRSHLALQLPDYMVPLAFVELEAIPYTTSGKVDRRRLPVPELEQRAHVAVPPANMAEQLVIDAFARILGRTDLGVLDDFFDFGGNSMKAVAAVAALASDFAITANDLFRLRTARAVASELPLRRGDLQARLSELAVALAEPPAPSLPPDLELQLARYRERWKPFAGLAMRNQMTYRDILLTGATGFLGAYLLRDLLVKTDAKLHVVVRAPSRQAAWDRLVGKAAYYFGPGWLDTHRRRIHLVVGELSAPKLGLDRGTYDALARTIDCVMHCAAVTKHYGDRATFVAGNVTSTEHLIELTRRAACDFNMISTLSVGGGDIPGVEHAVFTEFDCDIGQTSSNLYVQTKLDAEKAVIELRDEGVACGIFRVGFLTGDSTTLRFQDNAGDSGFVQTMRSYLALGRVPVSALARSFCPVNEVSAAVLALMGASSVLGHTHHLDRVLDTDDAERLLRGDPRLLPMPDAEFYAWLAAHMADPAIGKAATAMLLHEGLLDAAPETETLIVRDKTDRLLQRAGFAWSPVTAEQVWSLIDVAGKPG